MVDSQQSFLASHFCEPFGLRSAGSVAWLLRVTVASGGSVRQSALFGFDGIVGQVGIATNREADRKRMQGAGGNRMADRGLEIDSRWSSQQDGPIKSISLDDMIPDDRSVITWRCFSHFFSNTVLIPYLEQDGRAREFTVLRELQHFMSNAGIVFDHRYQSFRWIRNTLGKNGSPSRCRVVLLGMPRSRVREHTSGSAAFK